ncbi:PEP-CTERM sorting domain-containing protein [Methylobacillus arboreus]|uniref:PEP-CTERM sorting domain-containing protein n=1 Tax=Methylobacillus arboreus TaxID=755170 RepID=UPI001E49610E|nr:PEP-CTERM sorting domain-containing protein [Methylobacillus arboreus]MCB5190090.1 PEP-CTERM sorting domain-containing protein [Methylobacillus arboreus]
MKFPALGFLLTLAFAPAVHAATTISTIDQWDGEVSPFGTPDTATYGQTISIGEQAQVLESFSFILTDLNAAFTVEVGTWTGSRVGEIIYQSDPFRFSASSEYTEITAYPSVNLEANSQYVLYFTTSGIQDGVTSTNEWGFAPDTAYEGGTFVYLNNGNDRSQLTGTDWNTTLGGDLAFTATLAPVPEPSTYGLLLAGLGLIGFAARRTRSV